jgi:hypothetical protein
LLIKEKIRNLHYKMNGTISEVRIGLNDFQKI